MSHTPEKTVNINDIEKRMLQEVQADCPVKHIFGPGIYIRELYMKAGTLAVGHKQRFSHMNSFVKGKVLMIGEDGVKKELSAPLVFMAEPGRKIGYVLEDVIWQNIYATNETDIDTLEAIFLDKSEVSNTHQERKDYTKDHMDYMLVVEESGIPHEQVAIEVENPKDMIPMPIGFEWICIRNSELHGKGVFTTFPMKEGTIIAPAKKGDKRTPVGRYANHSSDPNASFVPIGDDVVLVALRDIEGCRGGNSGEEITVDYRQALRMRGITFEERSQCQA